MRATTRSLIEEVIREGKLVEAILQQIDEDEDIAVLVLGASKEATGPGPLVSSLAAGATPAVPDPDHHRTRAIWRSSEIQALA